MPANFCLPPKNVEAFKEAFRKGDLNFDKLVELSDKTSQERRDYFAPIVGEVNANGVNALFESKLLFKNQQNALGRWAKQVTGITPEVRRDIITRVSRLDKVLTPQEGKAFFQDLAEARLGVAVTEEEAKFVMDSSNKIQTLKAKADKDGKFKTEKERMEYGLAVQDLGQYIADKKLKADTKGPKALLKPKEITAHDVKKAAEAVGGFAKSTLATADLSGNLRPGIRVLLTHPSVWYKNFKNQFGDIATELGGNDAVRAIRAEVLSRPNALNGMYQKMGLPLTKDVEAFPSHALEKVPGVKRLYGASEASYTGLQVRNMADLADMFIAKAQEGGRNTKTDKKWQKDVGNLVGNMTGRANLGKYEGDMANTLNALFFSPRAMAASINTLRDPFRPGIDKFARVEASKNLAKIVVATGAMLALAGAMLPNDDAVEKDARSSKFGKIKVGNTTFDMTGGLGSIITLGARLATQKTKTSGGQVKSLAENFGDPDGIDIITDFFTNKTSPVAKAVIENLINHHDYAGNKPNPVTTLKGFVVPLPISNAWDSIHDPNSANDLLTIMADALGISTNSTKMGEVKWSDQKKLGIELQQFKDTVGEAKFKEAEKRYNQVYNDWLNGKGDNPANIPELKAVAPASREELMKNAKDEVRDYVFHEYKFKYEKSQQEKDAIKAKTKATREKNKARKDTYGY